MLDGLIAVMLSVWLSPRLNAGEQSTLQGKADGRVDCGLAAAALRSSGCKLDFKLDRMLISAQVVGIIIITRI